MTFAIAGIFGWLLIVATGLCLATAAKRGDELAAAALRNPPDSTRTAEIIPIDRARLATTK
jgi:hypothetical protein